MNKYLLPQALGAFLALAMFPAHAQPRYPGSDPGHMKVTLSSQQVIVGNRALSATWLIKPSGLGSLSLVDLIDSKELVLTGEVFQITLTNNRSYRASDLVLQKPRATALKPVSGAARFADSVRGQKVEIPLRSSDGQLNLIWRALARDGANYIRQEIDITPAAADCVIQEIVWLDQPVASARTAGQVDGSPLVVDNFFFGCEDPHARNLAASRLVTIGTWNPSDLQPAQTRLKSWPLDPALLSVGANAFTFQYERGPHRLDVWHVALIQDGHEVARDQHHGHTGTSHLDNTYTLNLPAVKSGARYELTAEIGTDPDFKLPAGSELESYGSVAIAGHEARISCRLPRNAPLRRGETLTVGFVAGVAPVGQLRRAFLCYLESERAHPYRPFLHYNSWYDTAWDPFALSETNCLEAIHVCGEELVKRYGVVLDALVFDDGWDDPKTLWQFHAGFPHGFRPLTDLCKQYRTHLGVWLSPFGGYGDPREQRLKFGREQGYEINPAGFSLAGPKYYAAFKRACVGMIRNYGINHFKFDGIAAGMYASGGAQYVLDTEAMRRLMVELRQEDPNLYINLTTGSWPSPFWLRYADSVWRQGGDMGLAGNGPRQQQWLTYRDQETFRNIVRKGPLYPLNSLMTQGVAYSRKGAAGDPTFNSAGFKDDVHAFFGSGTGLQELYIQPGKLTADDWKILAEAAKWSRANSDVFVDTHWIGGDPARAEVYGYASWTTRKGILMLRNPDDRPQDYALDLAAAFELPPGSPTRYRLKSPWGEESTKAPLTAQAGIPLRIHLPPLGIAVFDALPD